MTRFHRALAVGFTAGAAALLSAWRWAYLGSLRPEPAAAALARYAEPAATNYAAAKLRRLFWCDRQRVALRVLEDPELFDSVFPGYGESRLDGAFWGRYFRGQFDQTTYSPVLMRLTPTVVLHTSWLGSLDLFRRYGADVMVFGLSETFMGLPAGMLRDELYGAGAQVKVLQCARGHIFPDTLAWVSRAYADGGRRASLAVWGYSLSYTRPRPDHKQIDDGIRSLYRRWRAERFLGGSWLGWRAPEVPWGLFFGPALQERLDEGKSVPLLVPEGIRGDPRALEGLLRRDYLPRYAVDAREEDCGLREAPAQLDATLAQLLRFSDKVLIFMPPLTPLTTGQAPPCLLPAIRRMLESRAGPRVVVETGDWGSYGLDFADYVFSDGPGRWSVDPFHVNDGGARKITAALAGVIRREGLAGTAPPQR